MPVARSRVLRVGSPHQVVREIPAARCCSAERVRVIAPERVDAFERRDRVVAGLRPEDVADDGQVLDRVAVGVDDRVVEPGPDRRDLVAGHELHGR